MRPPTRGRRCHREDHQRAVGHHRAAPRPLLLGIGEPENIGVKSWEVIAKIAKPVANAPVYVVGEAYSDAQGWVEGALRSAEIVLTRHLGLKPVKTTTAS